MANLRYLPLSAPIRYTFQYSNFNYLIAGAVIEAVSGEKFEDFLKEKLLRPLGMERSETYLEAMRTAASMGMPMERAMESTVRKPTPSISSARR